uniref:EF-hand domain-containing protein n=1 Tax=Araucaria cunninghamii TaxID=56994 RepID=A0A0D6QR81_ARACU
MGRPRHMISIRAIPAPIWSESMLEASEQIDQKFRVSVRVWMAVFEDFLPIMADKLGHRDFMAELCNGFRLLADHKLGLITLESLKKNSAVLGLDSLTDSELQAMVQEGDLDGDGALNEHEFCVLMIRLSPSFMDEAEKWLEKALVQEVEETVRH